MHSTSRRSGETGQAVTPEEVAQLLSALADATRLRILALLRTGDHCVCEVHQGLGLAPPTASHHLALLRRAGLVARRRDRYWVHYQLASRYTDAFRSLVEGAVACVAASPQGREDRSKLEGLPVCCDHAPATTRADARQSPSRGRPGAARSRTDHTRGGPDDTRD
jgi:DNA-binding transcriptional ArsR family regulator